MTGLEKIIERIGADARARAERVLQEAEEDCLRMAKEYAARSEQTRQRIEKESEETLRSLLQGARAESEKTHTEILQSARAALLDEAYAKAREEICSNQYGKYRELLIALLASALLEQHRAEQESIAYGDEVEEIERFELVLNATDRERFGNAVVEGARRLCERRIGKEKAAKLSLAADTAQIDGGLILRFGAVELNCALDVLMADVRRETEAHVAQILFGEQ